jgi:transcriptional regulator with PAS, ATPase and Fis domain
MPRILISWIGQNDITAAERADPKQPGPLGRVCGAEAADHAVLLYNYPKAKIRLVSAWLKKLGAPPIQLRDETQIRKDPTDYMAIHEVEVAALMWVREKFGDEARITIHLSSGTPQMQAVWLILAGTRFPAELLQSSREQGVARVSFPFDLSAEYVADAMRRSDALLEKVSDGPIVQNPAFEKIMQRSKAMQRVVGRAAKVAPRNVPVLIQGEPGTGKELFARAIHQASQRKGPFIEVNCAAIPESLIESELFGHSKGAFSGATSERKGHFEEAEGGTIFLDEIGELPLPAQAKLLRALQEKRITRLGESRPRAVDARVIAATNRRLIEEMQESRFRDDLYQRLAHAVLHVPPLRDRPGDVGPTIDEFVEQIGSELADQPDYTENVLSSGAINLLLRHNWPGNVRELYNTLYRLLLWADRPTIGVDEVREELQQGLRSRPEAILGRPLDGNLQLDEVIREVASHYLGRALEESNYVKRRAALLVGFSNAVTFNNWLDKYQVESGPGKLRS